MSVLSVSRSGRLRQRCRTRLAEVEIPRPWDLQEFCRRLGHQRGRDLILRPVPALAGTLEITGAWLAYEDYDVIFYHPQTTPWHREQIVLHECAHMLSGHVPSMHTMGGVIAECFSEHWDTGKIAQILLRSRYDTPMEQEAEVLAGLIENIAERGPGLPTVLPDTIGSAGRAPHEVDEALQRFAAAFAAAR